MKCAVIFLACISVSLAATFPSAFGSGRQNFKASPFSYTPPKPVAPVHHVPVAHVAVHDARSATILKYGNEIQPDGSYNYFYETDNGIAAQEQGTPRNFGGNPPLVPDVAQGSFSWTSPEGQVVSISYVADENGYQPTGDAIPTPPPVPPQIARAIQYIQSVH